MKAIVPIGIAILVAMPVLAQEPTPITLTVRPAIAPVPALKYALLPPASDLQPGNAALLYYRAFSPEWWGYYQRADVKWHERLDEALKAPLDTLGKNHEFRSVAGSSMAREVDRAARREHCDWEMLPRIKQDTFNLLLPDVQGMRNFARILALRARYEIADGELDKAIYTLQTGYMLGRHMGEGPTLIQLLVGVAVTQVMNQQLEELLQHPKAPNLYWALAQLPQPFVNMRKPLGGETAAVESFLSGMKELEKEPVSVEQAEKILDDLMTKLRQVGMEKTDKIQITAVALSVYPKAKAALIAAGRPAAEVELMPVAQVVLLHSRDELLRLRDEMFKWLTLPYHESRGGIERAEAQYRQAREEATALPMVTELLPAVQKVRQAQMRADRKFAILRVIEAIRLHAATNEGNPPASLADIKVVPVPLDPFNNKSFEYSAAGDKFTLTAPLYGMHQGNGWKYEVTIKK